MSFWSKVGDVFSDIGGGLISGVTGMVGSIFGANKNKEAVEDTNNMNYQIAQENNKANAALAQKQMNFQERLYNDAKKNQWDMWNANNAYNDPSAQRQRMEAAGYNPFFSGATAGTATSTSASSAPGGASAQMTGANMQPALYDYNSVINNGATMMGAVTDAMAKMSQRNVYDASAENIRIENQYKGRKELATLNQMIEQTHNTRIRTQLESISAKFAERMNTQALTNAVQQNQLLETQVGIALQQKAMNAVQLNFLPDKARLEVARAASELVTMAVNRDYTKKQAKAVVQSMYESIQRERGLKFTNDQNDALKQTLRDMVKTQYETMENNKYSGNPLQFGQMFVSKGGPLDRFFQIVGLKD